MSLADRDYTKDLHTLLGIARHTTPEELRYAYEQAMSAATRSGDLPRARTLLGAYEALSREKRHQVFGRSYGVQARQDSVPDAPPTRHPSRSKREPRPRKWGMSLPIRILFLAVVVPATVLGLIGNLLPSSRTPEEAAPVGRPALSAVAPVSVSPTDAALYVEQMNGRADVTCQPAATDGSRQHFTCHASDGQGWDVSGTSSTDLAASVTSPSMFLQSARFDAYAGVAAVEECRRYARTLPVIVGPKTTSVMLNCGRGSLTFYLRPQDSLVYARSSSQSFRLTITAGDGETVTYDSRRKVYR